MVSRVPVSLVASEKLLFLFCIKPNFFLTFSLLSPSSDLKVESCCFYFVLNLFFFFTFSLPSPSSDLKVPNVLSSNSFLLKLIGLVSGSNLQLYVQMNRT